MKPFSTEEFSLSPPNDQMSTGRCWHLKKSPCSGSKLKTKASGQGAGSKWYMIRWYVAMGMEWFQCMQLKILHLGIKQECWVSLLTHFRINFLGIYWGLFGAQWGHLGDPWGCFDWYRVHLKKIWIENKSNRVWTIDAFSCVLVLQLVLVIFITITT